MMDSRPTETKLRGSVLQCTLATSVLVALLGGACGLVPGISPRGISPRAPLPVVTPTVPSQVKRAAAAAAQGDVAGAVGVVVPGLSVPLPADLVRSLPAGLTPDVAALIRAAGPLLATAVTAIAQAVDRRLAEKRAEEARIEEERRLRTAAAQLFYAAQCTQSQPGAQAAPRAAPGSPAELEAQAEQHFASGEPARAEPLLKRALELREKQLGPAHPDVARSLNRLAVVYLAMSNHVPALAVAVRGLDIREKILARGRQSKLEEAGDIGPSLDVAESLSTVATLYRASGAYEAALPLYRRALLLRERSLDLEHLCVAQSRSSLAELYQILGSYEPALSLFRQVLAVRERKLGAHHRDVAQARNNLASLYRSMGLYPRAEELYRAALESRLRLGEDHPDVAESLHDLGGLYRLTGDYAAAERNHQRALQIRRKKLGPGLETAQSLHALGGLYALTGDYRRAESLYREALEIRQKKLSADHPDVAESQADLADLHLAMGDFARAEPLYQRALEVRRSKFGPDHPAVAHSLVALAALHKARGDFRQAEAALVQARDIYVKRFGPEHPDVAESLHQLGALAHAAGQYPRAGDLYQQALSIREKKLGPDHPEVAESLTYQATLLVATGRAAQALPLLKRSLAISEQMLRSVGVVSSESRIDALLRVLRAQEEITYSLLTEEKIAAQAAPLAMAVALLRKGRSVDEAAGASRAIYRGLGAEDRQRFEELKALRGQIAHERLAGLDQEAAERVRRLGEQADQIEQELSRKSAPLRARGRLPGADEIVQKVAAALPQDGALVEIVAFRPYPFRATGTRPRGQALRYAALVLRPDGQVRVADLGPGEPIHQGIQEFLARVTGPMQVAGKREREAALQAGEPEVLKTGQALHRRVLAPLQPMLAGARQLFLSLDGQLNLVPLGALHDGTAHVGDRHRLIYLTSGRDLLRRDDDLRPSTSVALLARPDFMKLPPGWKEPAGGARGLDLVATGPGEAPVESAAREASVAGGLRLRSLLDPLRGTEQEARAIQKLLPGADLLLGAAATKEALLKMEAPGILHVATHGLFRPEPGRGRGSTRGLELVGEGLGQAPRPATDPLLGSMLLLAGVGTPIQHADGPGVLLQPAGLATALEVAGMNLWGTQLVVLSACETGRGDVSNLGQGVYGLRRAVMVAGAETLVTSLWKVDDEATRDLMTRYYRNLLAGSGRVEAMDEAAQYVRKRRRHVAYWAPFIVIGRSDPLEGFGKGAGKARKRRRK